MAHTRLAIIQTSFEDGNHQANFEKCLAKIDAVDETARIIVFPELFLHGFVTRGEAIETAFPVDAAAIHALQQKAKERGIVLVVGFAEKFDDEIYNSVAWIEPEGRIQIYRKNFLWLSDGGVFAPGEGHTVIRYDGFNFGLAICFDVEFPETGRALSSKGANVFIVCNGNMDPFEKVHRRAAQARAMENHAYVIMCNRIGTERGRHFVGDSLAVAPNGEVIVELGQTDLIGYVDIDQEPIDESRLHYNYLDVLERRADARAQLSPELDTVK